MRLPPCVLIRLSFASRQSTSSASSSSSFQGSNDYPCLDATITTSTQNPNSAPRRRPTTLSWGLTDSSSVPYRLAFGMVHSLTDLTWGLRYSNWEKGEKRRSKKRWKETEKETNNMSSSRSSYRIGGRSSSNNIAEGVPLLVVVVVVVVVVLELLLVVAAAM